MTGGALSDDDEVLAAELALGLLTREEARAAEARAVGNAGFATACAKWQDYAAALFSGAGSEMPSPSLWGAILARLPANDTAAPASRALRGWQAATGLAAAAALVFAVLGLDRAAPPPIIAPVPAAQAPLVAVLTGKDSGFVTISYNPGDGRLTVAPQGLVMGQHSAELWIIPGDGTPRSLGVIAAAAPGWRAAPRPASALIAAGGTMAITVEPLGGSPSGKPTGSVILSGKLTAA